ncbi:MAG: hypothetical protein ACK53Y_20990, partial [bacterium]
AAESLLHRKRGTPLTLIFQDPMGIWNHDYSQWYTQQGKAITLSFFFIQFGFLYVSTNYFIYIFTVHHTKYLYYNQ